MARTPGLRVIFAGTPEFAVCHLQALLDSPHQIVAVYTQPDRPAGRGKKISASPVKRLALEHQIAIFQPLSLKNNQQAQQLATLDADIMVVVAYGLLLPVAVLQIPRRGCINVHASLLPRWRGAAPIQRALAAGDKQTGVTIMQMDEGLDTGAMLLQASCPILPTDNASDLQDRLTSIGSQALLETLVMIQEDNINPKAQDDKLNCYASKITKKEAAINWSKSAAEIERQIRAFNPFPIAHTQIQGKAMRIRAAKLINEKNELNPQRGLPGEILTAENGLLIVACGRDALQITNIQLPGKKALAVSAVLHGYQDLFVPGKVLGH